MDYNRDREGHQRLYSFITILFALNLCSDSAEDAAFEHLRLRLRSTRELEDLQLIHEIVQATSLPY